MLYWFSLRPSEQVALKWDTIDDEYIHIELSRVRNEEKADPKTHESHRRIQLRPTLRKILAEQKELVRDFDSPYVFLNMQGRPNPSGQTEGTLVKGDENERPILSAHV